LQALIAEAVEDVYNNCDFGTFPKMSDLVDAAARTMAGKKYEGEIKSNLQAAIEVRLGMLTRRAMGRIFDCKNSIPLIDELLKYPTIIEMGYLSQDHGCLLTLFLLSAVREHIKVEPCRRIRGLHHVTVVEEAHNIVGRSGQAKASEEIADPKAFAANYISRMLAELRSLGEGIIIVDQLPSAVASEVVKNTGTKLAYRLVSNEDREDLGGAMLLGGTEIEEIARLKTGDAYFYTEGLHLPRRVRCLSANEYLQLGDFADPALILSLIKSERWFFENRINRVGIRRTISEFLDNARALSIEYGGKLEQMNQHISVYDNDIADISQKAEKNIAYLEHIIEDFDNVVAMIEDYSNRNPDKFSVACKILLDRWFDSVRGILTESAKDFYILKDTIEQKMLSRR